MMTQSWRSWCYKLGLASVLALGGAIAAFRDCAFAQIVPDATLGAERSVVTPNAGGGSVDLITGGATRGANLFHSFGQFSVLTGRGAYFNNSLQIQNIISRVTGGSISNIDGLLRANGKANLFLINPNGIIFGPNASLNIGGSFLASTARAVKFADGTEFSATAPQTTPLLTINVPQGLQFGANPGSIRNLSQATGSGGETVGLQVLPGKSLALVGGDVALEGGSLTAAGGRIELGSVAGSGLVSLTLQGPGLALGYESVPAFSDIRLSSVASVNASGNGGGNIQVQGGRVTLTEGASIVADTLGSVNGGSINIQADQLTVQDRASISASTFGSGAGGNLSLTASKSVELIGNGRFELLEKLLARTFNPVSDRANGLFALSAGTGAAGNITINTDRLTLRDGAVVLPTTFLQGQAGNLSVTASESVELINSGLIAGTSAAGASGDLTINTGHLIVRDGALVTTTTVGQGAGGNINVTADTVELSGTPVNALVPTGIFATTDSGIGKGGNITLGTRQLIVRDGTAISTTSGRLSAQGVIPVGGSGGNIVVNASEKVELAGISANGLFQTILGTTTFSDSPAGDLTLATGKLIVRDGAQLSTATVGGGKAGNLMLQAAQSVEVIGTSVDGRSRSGLEAASGDAFVRLAPTGASGTLRIATGELIVRDGAEVAVNSLGSGATGDLEITARSIRLENIGVITATTSSGNGGDITLRTQDLLLLRHGSQISTTAGNNQNGGNGGNITIDPRFIIAIPSENSDITANAFQGSGGNIKIAAQGIFGIQSRQRDTPQSDITARSQFGINGTVQLITLNINPTLDLVVLPTNLVDAAGLIAQSCPAYAQPQAKKIAVTPSPGFILSARARNGNTGRDRMDAANDPIAALLEPSKFVVSGRGGIPPSPTQPLSSDAVLTNWATLNPKTNHRSGKAHSSNPTSPPPTQIVEATGWVIGSKGEVILTAQAPTVTPDIPWLKPTTCHAQ